MAFRAVAVGSEGIYEPRSFTSSAVGRMARFPLVS